MTRELQTRAVITEIECESCNGRGTYEDEIHMHTLVKIVVLDCGECGGEGVIEIEMEDA